MQEKNRNGAIVSIVSLIVLSFFISLPAHAATSTDEKTVSFFSFCFSTTQEDPVLPFLKPVRNFMEKHLGVTSHLCENSRLKTGPANVSSFFSNTEDTVGESWEKARDRVKKSLWYKAIQGML